MRETRMGLRYRTASAIVATLAVVLALGACSAEEPAAAPVEEQITAGQLRSGEATGFLHRPVDRAAAPFALTDQNGASVSLQDLRGKWVLVDWIYTNCMTVCPAMTAELKIVQNALEDRVGDQIQIVSISFDPERDTVEAMREHAEKAKANIPGWSWLTGTQEQTDAVAEAYGVSFGASMPMDGVAMFDHTALLVVIDDEGRERHRYFGAGWTQDLLERLEADLPPRSAASSVAHMPSESSAQVAPPESAAAPADITALEDQALSFAWEEWELTPGTTSQVLYQFPHAETASEYFRARVELSKDRGWESVKADLVAEEGFEYDVLKGPDGDFLAMGVTLNMAIKVTGLAFQGTYNGMLDVFDLCCVVQ